MPTKKQKKYWESLKGKKPKNMKGLKLGWGWNKGKHFSQETKNKISEARKRNPIRYWLGKFGDPRKSGKNHWNWKGGISGENKKLRNSIEYKNWQMEVYKRGYFSCQDCGKHCKNDIIAHHLKEWSKFPKLRFDIDNGITLSKKAHDEFHIKYGKKNNTKEQLEEFLYQPRVKAFAG